MLLMSALESSQQRASSWTVPAAAAYELAEQAGTPSGPVGDSSYLARLRHRVDTEVATEGRAVLSRALHHMDVHRADIALGFGRWHGDWAPWNMGWRGDRLQVWDWERSCTDVPARLRPGALRASEAAATRAA